MSKDEGLREDGVTAGFQDTRVEEEHPKNGSDDGNYQKRKEAVAELPREEKAGKKCMDPCPRFSCVAEPESCESNCGRCLDNPCLLCEYDCGAEREDVLLREDYKNYKRWYGGKKTDAIYKERVAERRVELYDRKDEIDDEIELMKEQSRDSILPTKLAWMFKQKRVKDLKKEKKKIELKIEEGEELFTYE